MAGVRSFKPAGITWPSKPLHLPPTSLSRSLSLRCATLRYAFLAGKYFLTVIMLLAFLVGKREVEVFVCATWRKREQKFSLPDKRYESHLLLQPLLHLVSPTTGMQSPSPQKSSSSWAGEKSFPLLAFQQPLIHRV